VGMRTDLVSTPAPALTAGALGVVPMVVGLWPVFLTGMYGMTKRREKVAAQEQKAAVNVAVQETEAKAAAELETRLAKADADKKKALEKAEKEKEAAIAKALEEAAAEKAPSEEDEATTGDEPANGEDK